MTVRRERNGVRKVRIAALAGSAALALVLSACGSDAQTGTTPTSGAAPTSASAPMTEDSGSEATEGSEDSGSEATEGSEDSGSEPTEGSGSEGTEGSGAGPSEVEITGDASAVKVGLAYDIGGRGDQSFNDSAAAGLDKAEAAGAEIVGELEAAAGETDAAKEDRLQQLVSDGANNIIGVGFAYAVPMGAVAEEHPDVHFAIIDDSSLCDPAREGGPLENVACLTFAEEQGSYLVGVAAALKSESGQVGFVGGVNTPLIQKFQAGYEAGVKATNPDATIDSKYITEPPDFTGFNDPNKGETIARGMYDSGADVVYAAAGGSGAGVFKAAQAAGKFGIGVDSDQYNIPSLADVKDVIITSMVKNVDVAVFDDIAASANGEPLSGQRVYDLTTGGISYSVSGGGVDQFADQLEAAKQQIISGEITVPTTVGG